MLVKIYAERGYAPLWSDNGQYTDTGRAIVSKLENSSSLGLHPAGYYTQVLSSWLQMQEPQTATRLDLVLTDSLIEYFDNLANSQTGEKPGDDSTWFATQAITDANNEALRFFRGDASFRETTDRLQPRSYRYDDLIAALKEKHKILSEGGYTTIADGAILKPGMQDSRVQQLRHRLAQSGDHTETYVTDPNLYDAALEASVKTFQERHGLEADGLIGGKTFAELNTTVEARIAQIEINLDRWRWLPRDLGDNHIIVNTAGFQMDMVLNGHHALYMNVVVGKPKHKTPVFSKDMEHIVFNPSWNVPKSIASKELLPRELANPGYLSGKNFVAVSHTDKSTRSVDSFAAYELEPSSFTSQYRLKQLPGSNNALGTVKFMLPNKHAIYLHDTNAKTLFQKTTRAFSHGCIRVEDPVKLAKTLLMNDGHTEHSVEQRFATDKSKTIRLDSPLPVHMTYQTAWVDEHGKLNFRPDIYGHDKHAVQSYKNQRPHLTNTERQLLLQHSSFASSEL